MFHLRFLLYWAIALTILTLISSITIGFFSFLPGLILMWLIYGVFVGSASVFYNRNNTQLAIVPEVVDSAKLIPISIALAHLLFFPLYIEYYTGNTITVVILNLLTGNSNYQAYQDYFNSESLGAFSIYKLPYILGAGILKFLFIATVCRVFGYKKHISWIEILSIVLMVLTILLVSAARGTSFEFFELIMTFVFAMLLRRRRFSNKNWFSTKTMLFLGGIIFCMMLIFGYNIDIRGDFECVTREFCYDNQALLAQISPTLGKLSYQISGYFIFGIYFTSVSLLSINFNSINGFLLFFIPSGVTLATNGQSYVEAICDNQIDCAAAWIPDVINQIGNLGFIGLFIFICFLGYWSCRLYNNMVKGSVISSIILYFIVIYMTSLPVGNFLTTSSAGVISVCIAILIKFFPLLERLFLGYFKLKQI